MARIIVFFLAIGFSMTFAGDTPMQDDDPEFTALVKSMTPEQLHEIVVDLETDPLGKHADGLRAGLLVYFEDVDFVFCVTKTIVLLNESKKKRLHAPVWMQVIFGSGDYVTQHPEQIDDEFAYTLAGWESALRVYEKITSEKPKARLDELDRLVGLRNGGQLGDYVRDQLCEDAGDSSSN
jgi:hypothetical protein